MFCLVEAPDEKVLERVHRKRNGLIAKEITELFASAERWAAVDTIDD